MKRMVGSILAVIVMAAAFNAAAEVVALNSANRNGFTDATGWSDGKAPHGGADYWLIGNELRTAWSRDETFLGDTLNLGSVSGASGGYGKRYSTINDNRKASYTTTIPAFHWYNGAWANISGNAGVSTIAGNMLIIYHSTSPCEHVFNLNVNGDRTFKVAANISSADTKAVITWQNSSGTTQATMDNGLYRQLILSGDNSGYKGTFAHNEAFGPLILASASAIGDPNAANPAAIALATDAAFAIDGDFEQNPSRGICLNGADAYFMAWPKNCSRYTVKYPISKAGGVDGKLIVRGGGRVTLDCAYTAGDIEVQSGTLVLGRNLTLPEGLNIHVCSGAVLLQEAGFPGVTVTTDDGGYVALEIPYDSQTKTASPVTMTAAAFNALLKNPDGTVAVALSETIAIPFVETNVLNVITITDGSVTLPEVKDATRKTYGLPTTRFELVTDADGQHVKLFARPALAKTIADGNIHNLGGSNWTDGLNPHAGADYYSTGVWDDYMRLGSGANTPSFVFGGESLSIIDRGVRDYAVIAEFGDLRLFGGTLINVGHGDGQANLARNLTGGVFVDASATDAAPAKFRFDAATTEGGMDAKLTGSGSFCYEGADAAMPLNLRNDAEDFTGHLLFSGSMEVRIGGKDGLVFGGALAALDDCAVQVAGPVGVPGALKIVATDDLAVQTATRGWKVADGSLGVVEGKTLSFNPPTLSVSGTLCKTGTGTLEMGCATEAVGATFRVQEGSLMPKSTTCCAGFDEVHFGEGTTLALDATETDAGVKAKGLQVRHVTVAQDGKLNVEVRNWQAVSENGGTVTCAVLTVPDSEPDLSDVINLTGRGAAKKLTRVTDGGFVTYVASYSIPGLSIIVR